MSGHPENTSGRPREPAAGLAEGGARPERHPEVRPAGGPVFGVAQQHGGGAWRLHAHVTGAVPQEARDVLGAHLRLLALGARAGGDIRRQDACLRAARLLEHGRLDTVALAGVRYRVVRAERFWRTGPYGPEPPPAADSGAARLEHDPAGGFVIGPGAAGPAGCGPDARLPAGVPACGSVPEAVRRDALRAVRSHPGGVLLPASFMTVERRGGQWVPHDTGTSFTPHGARAGLVAHLRFLAPWQLRLDPAERAAYAAAADRLNAERPDELIVCGRHFRIVRVERLVRVGADGPEPPRPSDPDPRPARPASGDEPPRPGTGRAAGPGEPADGTGDRGPRGIG